LIRPKSRQITTPKLNPLKRDEQSRP